MNKQKESETKTYKLRQEAEILLIEKREQSGLSHSGSDNGKLIYEFELHQIQLEMLNEELRLAKEKAELPEKKYTELNYMILPHQVTLHLPEQVKLPI